MGGALCEFEDDENGGLQLFMLVPVLVEACGKCRGCAVYNSTWLEEFSKAAVASGQDIAGHMESIGNGGFFS